MPRHEQYEELCTLAMIGEVSAGEMQDLREHLSKCAACQEQYREFTQFVLPQLSLSAENSASFETGYSTADKQRLRREFLARAERSGISFTREALREAPPIASRAVHSIRQFRPSPALYRGALAASIAILLFTAGYATHLALVHREMAFLSHNAGTRAVSPQGRASQHPGTAPDSAALLRAAEEVDQKLIAALDKQLVASRAKLSTAQRSLKDYEASQSALQATVQAKSSQIAALESQAQGKDQSVAELRAQMAELQQRIDQGQALAAADQLRIRDLTDQLSSQTASLDRERQLLAAGRDVRDLMGARNLHIIDVHDANGSGRDRKAFGRVFYTEGKSLIFYAFDLDEKKVLNTNYSFEAWGERLGQPGSVKSLGVLYVDDKAQRRWSLKVDNPQQLVEINSVFVTLEPRKGEGDQPHGQKILYAFLGGEPNHP